jgi:type IV pilus assembly protein PilE
MTNPSTLRQRQVAEFGFTLIELMITVAVIAILSAIAIPQYTDYVIRGRIPDATSALATKKVQAEQYFQDHRTYADILPDVNIGCAADNVASRFYTFACTAQTATTFTIQATGINQMAGFNYTINESNVKTSNITTTGWAAASPPNCWFTKKPSGGVGQC